MSRFFAADTYGLKTRKKNQKIQYNVIQFQALRIDSITIKVPVLLKLRVN